MNSLDLSATPEQVAMIASPKTVRERCQRVFALAQQGKTHFSVHLDRLDRAVDRTLAVTRRNYPDGKIPFHSRWEHFRAGGIDRVGHQLALKNADPWERARTYYDLVIPSVLLDAGSGPGWKYHESMSGKDYARSEGLAVASFDLFMHGGFSSDLKHPHRADIQGLESFSPEKLAKGFQVSNLNPLAGLDSRAVLIQGLGRACESAKAFFPAGPGVTPRLGHLVDFLRTRLSAPGVLPATEILHAVLFGLGGAWPSRIRIGGQPFGDVWHYRPWGETPSVDTLVPFHKLSQWLTYSLIEPLEAAGLEVTDVDQLTGLPEYRNGGLLLDSGVLELRDSSLAAKVHQPGSELIIEWRALTVCLLDEIGTKVREKLRKTPKELPLARILQGGTWSAGREIAAEKRPPLGGPPLQLESDGTVF